MTKIRDMNVGILVGRFQPLHKGHVKAIEFARNNSEKLFVIVGSAEKSNQKRNPFSFEERKKMIDLALKERKLQDNISIVPINDAKNHTEWIESIKNAIGEYNLEFRDKNGGIIYPEETIRMIYSGAPQLIDPSSIRLSSESGDINLGLDVKEVINRAEISIMELSPENSFVVGSFSPENPPKALIFSIDVDKRER